MGGGKLVPEKSWWGKKLVHREEYIPVPPPSTKVFEKEYCN